MNERIKELLKQSGLQPYYDAQEGQIEKFAELIVQDCAQQMVQANMSNPEYAKAMDAYYEQKWAHRFD